MQRLVYSSVNMLLTMITMHVRPNRWTDRRKNIMATARRFVLTNASRAKMKFKKNEAQ